jgi:hypothetical protein
MNRITLIIAISVVAPFQTVAAYNALTFLDLAGTSEKIIVGVIVKVDEDTVDVKVEDLLVGQADAQDTIVVTKFRDWVCAWRWEHYAVGQKLLMFLDRDTQQLGKRYAIRGGGDEGESAIVGEIVHANFSIPGQVAKPVRTQVRYQLLRAAIVDFRATFRVTRSNDPWRKEGDYFVNVPLERIERISNPAPSGFQKRYPPGTKPPVTKLAPRSQSVEPRFESRSPLHKFLVEQIDEQRQLIAKYPQPAD